MSSQRGFATLPTVKCSSCGKQIEIINMGSHLCGASGRGTEVETRSLAGSNSYSDPHGENRGKRAYDMQTYAPDATSVSRRLAQQSSRIPRPAHSNPTTSSAKPDPQPAYKPQGPVPHGSAGPHSDRAGININVHASPHGSSGRTRGLGTEGENGRAGFGIGRSATEPIRSPRLETRQPMPAPWPASGRGPRQQASSYADEYKIESPYGYETASKHGPTSRTALHGSGAATTSPGRSDTSVFDKLMTDLQHTMNDTLVPPLIRHDDVYASDYETPPSSPGLPEPSAIDHRLKWVQQQQANGARNVAPSDEVESGYSDHRAPGEHDGFDDWDESPANREPWGPKRQESLKRPSRNHRHDMEGGPCPQKPPSSRGKCRSCNNDIVGKSISSADGRLTGRYHKACFVCAECTRPFDSLEFYVLSDRPYCELDYHSLNGSLCGTCKRGIEGRYLEDEALVKYHYSGCFCCDDCGRDLIDGYFELNNRVYCERHATRRVERANALAAARISASTEVSDMSDAYIASGDRSNSFRTPPVSVPSTPKSKSGKKNQRGDGANKGKRGRSGDGLRGEDGPLDREHEGGIGNERTQGEGKSTEKTQRIDAAGRRDRTRDRDRGKDAESIGSKPGRNRSTARLPEDTDVPAPNPPKRAPTMPTITSKPGGRPRNSEEDGSRGPPTPAAGQGLKRSQTERLASASRNWREASRKEPAGLPGGSTKSASPPPPPSLRGQPGKPKANGKWLLPPPPLPIPGPPTTGSADRRADKAVMLQRRMTNIGMFINA